MIEKEFWENGNIKKYRVGMKVKYFDENGKSLREMYHAKRGFWLTAVETDLKIYLSMDDILSIDFCNLYKAIRRGQTMNNFYSTDPAMKLENAIERSYLWYV